MTRRKTAQQKGKNPSVLTAPATASAAAGAPTETTTKTPDWKQHPIYIAVATAVATVGIMVLLFKEVLLPTQIKTIENELVELRKQRTEESAAVVSKADQHAKEIAALKSSHQYELSRLSKTKSAVDAQLSKESQARSTLSAELASVALKDMFTEKNPLPLGFRRIALRDPLDTIRQKYLELSLLFPADDKLVAFKLNHKVFTQITFYAGRKKDNDAGKVGHITLQIANKDIASSLIDTLTTTFGKPTKETTSSASWANIANHSLYVSRGKSPRYFLMPVGFNPVLDDDE